MTKSLALQNSIISYLRITKSMYRCLVLLRERYCYKNFWTKIAHKPQDKMQESGSRELETFTFVDKMSLRLTFFAANG